MIINVNRKIGNYSSTFKVNCGFDDENVHLEINTTGDQRNHTCRMDIPKDSFRVLVTKMKEKASGTNSSIEELYSNNQANLSFGLTNDHVDKKWVFIIDVRDGDQVQEWEKFYFTDSQIDKILDKMSMKNY